MPPSIKLCSGYNQRLTEASNALRRHANVMNEAVNKAMQLPQSGPTEEQRKHFGERLLASFSEQTAWDAYREHLAEHGMLPGLPRRDVA